MKTLTKEDQEKISPMDALKILKEGNKRFVNNLKVNRNLLQQVNETRDSQHPFAVIISCMDSRTSAELIFDQGLGDIFSIRIAGNVINEDILGSAEFGCKVVGAKIVVVLGHTSCGAIKGAVDDVGLGHLHFITSKIKRCLHDTHHDKNHLSPSDVIQKVTYDNVELGIEDLRTRSAILNQLEYDRKIMIVGGIYDVNTGVVDFIDSK